MKNQLINEITRRMLPVLDNAQMMQLEAVLAHCLWEVEVVPSTAVPVAEVSNTAL